MGRHFFERKDRRLFPFQQPGTIPYDEADNGTPKRQVHWDLFCIQSPGIRRWRNLFARDKTDSERNGIIFFGRIEGR